MPVGAKRGPWSAPSLGFPDPNLSDRVVTLRPWARGDTRARYLAFLDPQCLRFSYPLEGAPTEAEVAALFDTNEQDRLLGKELNLAVVDAGEVNCVLGAASVYDVNPEHRSAAVGYWLAGHARGRGAATRTLRLLAAWAFDSLEVERLELTAAPDNVASHRVAERCGFIREGVLRSHLPFKGARRDTVIFSLLPGELTHP
jgi:RimJ/RimL family protein N-acetyltransferase